MKHRRADSISYALSAADYVGLSLDPQQQERLSSFYEWLHGEATAAGGIGPNERGRLWQRHIADSLVLGRDLAGGDNCIDIGSGVGLPGIPLAVAFPRIEFTLLDRAGRRTHLARRAIAVLGLTNCRVVQADVAATEGTYDRVVSRAALPPTELLIHVKHLLKRPGIAAIGYSRYKKPPEILDAEGGWAVSLVEVPFEVLDSAASLLRIEAT